MPEKPTSKGELTRAGIVACARRLFYERGYDGASFSDIVTASGLSRGHINHYFKTKDDILRAVVAQRLHELRVLISLWEEASPDPRDRLHAFVAMVASHGTALTAYGCPIGSLNTELGKARPDLQTEARALFDLFRDWISAQYAALGEADPRARALHLLARAQGIAVLAHVYRDAAWLERETRALQAWLDADLSGGRP